MAYIIAGTRGGLQPGVRRWTWLPTLVRELVEGRCSLERLYDALVAHARPCHVGIAVNNSCNLACRHCYLQVRRPYGEVLSPAEWARVFRDVATTPGVRLVSLVGKEVFVNDAGVELVRALVRAAPPRCGVVTNGTRLGSVLADLRALDYVDISFDGVGAVHDAVRGRGAFERTASQLPAAVRTLGPRRLWAVTTVQRVNFAVIPETLEDLARRGLRRFGLQFYVPTPVTPRELALGPAELEEFFVRVLPRLGQRSFPGRVRVLLEADAMFHPEVLALLEGLGYIDLRRLRVDTEGHLYQTRRLGRAVRLTLQVAPLPVGFWRTVRITAEGLYLGAEDSVDVTRYGERAIGSVRTTPFRDLFRRGLESERFRTLLKEYYETRLPILIEAVNGGRHAPEVAGTRPRPSPGLDLAGVSAG